MKLFEPSHRHDRLRFQPGVHLKWGFAHGGYIGMLSSLCFHF